MESHIPVKLNICGSTANRINKNISMLALEIIAFAFLPVD